MSLSTSRTALTLRLRDLAVGVVRVIWNRLKRADDEARAAADPRLRQEMTGYFCAGSWGTVLSMGESPKGIVLSKGLPGESDYFMCFL